MERQNKYRVIVSARAAQMLVSHAAFLAQTNPAAAERLTVEFEKAAKLRDQLGELRQQWSDMHSVGDSKLKKPRKNSKKQSPKSKKVHI